MSDRGGAAPYARMQSIDESAWIAPSAQVYGKVSVGRGSSLWHNVVVRAECQEVRIGRMTNVQDFVMIHVGYDDPTFFRRLFKRTTGMTPAAYRRKYAPIVA